MGMEMFDEVEIKMADSHAHALLKTAMELVNDPDARIMFEFASDKLKKLVKIIGELYGLGKKTEIVDIEVLDDYE